MTISLLDTATPLDRRLLLPVFVAGLILAVVAVDRMVASSRSTVTLAVAGLALFRAAGHQRDRNRS